MRTVGTLLALAAHPVTPGCSRSLRAMVRAWLCTALPARWKCRARPALLRNLRGSLSRRVAVSTQVRTTVRLSCTRLPRSLWVGS